MIKEELKKISSSLIVILIASIIGVFLLMAVYLLPTDPIERNVARSAEYIADEGMYPHLYEWCTSRLDNSTDSIMMLEAADKSDDTLLNKVMLIHRGYYSDDSSYNALIRRYVDNVPFEGESSYARYWHGYHLFIKPLLSIVSYKEIRIINGIVQTFINCLIMFLLFKTGNRGYIIPYIISILMIMPIALAYSLQFSSCFYIFSLCSLIIMFLRYRGINNKYHLVFLFNGICLAYFDFLTYPIATLGVPLLFYTTVSEEKFKDKIVSLFTNCIQWGMGYALMWMNKWIFASVLTDSNIIEDAVVTILRRTSSSEGETKFLISEVIAKNLEKFNNTPFIYLFGLFMIAGVIILIIKRVDIRKKVSDIVIYLFIALLPFMWYVLASNHSMIHNYFTNKGLIVSVMSLMFMLISIYKETKEERI